jgi:acyl carrier protein
MNQHSREEIVAEFISLIQPYIHASGDHVITERSDLIADLNVNSARLVDIILETEDRFKIRIDDAAADRLHTVGDAADLIVATTAPGTAAPGVARAG